MDNVTKRKRNFCFIEFEHEETVPYAVELLRDVRLFGRHLQMQNKTTGAGMHQRTMSAPNPMQFVPPFQQGFVQQGFNPQQLIQQQQQMMIQQQYSRQYSDHSHDRSRHHERNRSHERYDQNYQDQNYRDYRNQDQQNYRGQDYRNQHNYRDDHRNQDYQNYRDRSHDRRSSYDNRNNHGRQRRR